MKIRGGEDERSFTVHADLIGHYSPSLLEAYSDVVTDTERDRSRSPGLIKFEDDGVHLRDVSSQTLEIALEWVYHQRLYKRASGAEQAAGGVHEVKPERSDEEKSRATRERQTTDSSALTETSNEVASQSKSEEGTRHDTPISVIAEAVQTTSQTTTPITTFEELLNIYIFAETYEFPLLKIAAVRQWQTLALKRVRCLSRVISRAYDNLSSESKLIGLIAYHHALWERTNPAEANAAEDGMPQVFFRDVLKWERVIRARSDRGKLRSVACEFHDHASKAEQVSCDAEYRDSMEEVNWRKRKNQVEHELGRLKKRVELHDENFHQIKKLTKNAWAKNLKVDDDSLITEV
jgi:hypothetical protein